MSGGRSSTTSLSQKNTKISDDDSMNGIPLSPTSGIPHRSPGAISGDVLRSKNKKRDDAIRKKVEQELGKQRSARRRSGPHTALNRSKSTVSSLRPNGAVTISEGARILQAAQLMAAKRTDAVLVLGERGDLMGILTDKDIAFRVVAEGLDLRTTTVAQVMTPDPIAVFDKGSRNEALNIMISRRFRHLPVISEVEEYDGEGFAVQSHVVGLLDITKCVFERLDDLERKVNEDQSIINAMDVLERRGNMNPEKIDTMRTEHECPDIASVIVKGGKKLGDFPSIAVKSSVHEAARVMKQFHSTAVLVTGTPDGADKIAGIFTTKDIVLRVIAATLDPNTTSVVRVMTPHPDFVPSKASILDALKKLHAGHFLHLPVIDDTVPVGLVDVMTLTIAMLTYLVSKSGITTDLSDEGPMWNHFWNNTFSGAVEPDRVSQTSDSRNALSSSYVLKSSGRERAHSPEASIRESCVSRQLFIPDGPFSFKLKDILPSGSGKIYRFSSKSNSILALYENVCAKTGYTSKYSEETPSELDIFTSDGTPLRLCYLDDEGDVVVLESDKDLQEAVHMAFAINSTRLVVYLGDPSSNHVSFIQAAHSRVSSVSSASFGNQDRHVEPVNTLFQTLKEAPMAVNVALSAGVIVAAYWIIRRIR